MGLGLAAAGVGTFAVYKVQDYNKLISCKFKQVLKVQLCNKCIRFKFVW